MTLLFACLFLIFWDSVSLCSPGCLIVSLHRPGWPVSQRSTCLCLLECHYAQLDIWMIRSLTFSKKVSLRWAAVWCPKGLGGVPGQGANWRLEERCELETDDPFMGLPVQAGWGASLRCPPDRHCTGLGARPCPRWPLPGTIMHDQDISLLRPRLRQAQTLRYTGHH